MDFLQKPVQHIKGVGPKTALLLNKINIFTVEDILTHFPRTYEDRTIIKPVFKLLDGETTSVIGEVSLIDRDRYTQRGKHITRIVIKNETGHVVGVWFNQKFLKNSFKIGEKYLFYGKISKLYGEIQIVNPQYEKIEESINNCIIPVYSVTKNLSQKILRNIINRLINVEGLKFPESIPDDLRKRLNLISASDAIKNIHFPEDTHKVKEAEFRIKFEEFLV